MPYRYVVDASQSCSSVRFLGFFVLLSWQFSCGHISSLVCFCRCFPLSCLVLHIITPALCHSQASPEYSIKSSDFSGFLSVPRSSFQHPCKVCVGADFWSVDVTLDYLVTKAAWICPPATSCVPIFGYFFHRAPFYDTMQLYAERKRACVHDCKRTFIYCSSCGLLHHLFEIMV